MWRYEEDTTAAVLTARGNIESGHRKQGTVLFPKTAVLFYMHSGVEYSLNHYKCELLMEKLPRFLQGCPVYRLDENICFLDGGRGAPQAVDTLETLAALGVKNVISIGMFGAFSEKIKVGEILVPNKAFVEEGTSLHYYKTLDLAVPDQTLFERLTCRLGAKSYPIVTTDAVYRQTFYKERLWRKQGAVGVDMETSALFRVGNYLGVKVAALLMASDRHPQDESVPKWEWEMTEAMRQELFKKALAAAVEFAPELN